VLWNIDQEVFLLSDVSSSVTIGLIQAVILGPSVASWRLSMTSQVLAQSRHCCTVRNSPRTTNPWWVEFYARVPKTFNALSQFLHPFLVFST
jgi:hypothetical protein